jgi:hypothetical protein
MALQYIDRSTLRQQLQGFASRSVSRPDLERWFKEILVGNDVEVAADDSDLVFKVLYMFDDPPVPDAELGSLASHILWILDNALPERVLHDLLEILRDYDRLKQLLGKKVEGKLSPTGWSNALRSTRLGPGLTKRLERLERDDISKLEKAFREGDLASMAAQLSA